MHCPPIKPTASPLPTAKLTRRRLIPVYRGMQSHTAGALFRWHGFCASADRRTSHCRRHGRGAGISGEPTRPLVKVDVHQPDVKRFRAYIPRKSYHPRCIVETGDWTAEVGIAITVYSSSNTAVHVGWAQQLEAGVFAGRGCHRDDRFRSPGVRSMVEDQRYYDTSMSSNRGHRPHRHLAHPDLRSFKIALRHVERMYPSTTASDHRRRDGPGHSGAAKDVPDMRVTPPSPSDTRIVSPGAGREKRFISWLLPCRYVCPVPGSLIVLVEKPSRCTSSCWSWPAELVCRKLCQSADQQVDRFRQPAPFGRTTTGRAVEVHQRRNCQIQVGQLCPGWKSGDLGHSGSTEPTRMKCGRQMLHQIDLLGLRRTRSLPAAITIDRLVLCACRFAAGSMSRQYGPGSARRAGEGRLRWRRGDQLHTYRANIVQLAENVSSRNGLNAATVALGAMPMMPRPSCHASSSCPLRRHARHQHSGTASITVAALHRHRWQHGDRPCGSWWSSAAWVCVRLGDQSRVHPVMTRVHARKQHQIIVRGRRSSDAGNYFQSATSQDQTRSTFHRPGRAIKKPSAKSLPVWLLVPRPTALHPAPPCEAHRQEPVRLPVYRLGPRCVTRWSLLDKSCRRRCRYGLLPGPRSPYAGVRSPQNRNVTLEQGVESPSKVVIRPPSAVTKITVKRADSSPMKASRSPSKGAKFCHRVNRSSAFKGPVRPPWGPKGRSSACVLSGSTMGGATLTGSTTLTGQPLGPGSTT